MYLETVPRSRKSVSMELFIYYPPLGLIRSRAREIGLEGAIVETGRIRLAKHTDVELAFTLPVDRHKTVHHLGAVVLDPTDAGTELRFSEQNPEALRALRHLLQTH